MPKGTCIGFLPPSSVIWGWGEFIMLIYPCITVSRIRSTASEPSKAWDGKLNWKNTVIFETLCPPWLERSQDDMKTVENGGSTLLQSTCTSYTYCELPIKAQLFCTNNRPSCLAPEWFFVSSRETGGLWPQNYKRNVFIARVTAGDDYYFFLCQKEMLQAAKRVFRLI